MKCKLKNKTWKLASRAISIVMCIVLLNNSIIGSTLVFAIGADESQQTSENEEISKSQNNDSENVVNEKKAEENKVPTPRGNNIGDLPDQCLQDVFNKFDETLGWEIGSSCIIDFKHNPVEQPPSLPGTYFFRNFSLTDMSLEIEGAEDIGIEKLGNLKFKFIRNKKNVAGHRVLTPKVIFSYTADLWVGGPIHMGGPSFVTKSGENNLYWRGKKPFPLELEVTPTLLLEKDQQERTVVVGSSFNQVATDFFKVNQSAGKVSSEITRKPDFSISGNTKATIKVWDEYNNPQSFDVPFKVKADKTNLVLNNVDLYVGDQFDPDSPLKNVTDKDGNKLSAKDFTHYYIYPEGESATDKWITKELDTRKPGKYKVRVYYWGGPRFSEEATITVKDETKLELQDVQLYVGEKFNPDSPFKNVTDKYGNKLSAKDFTHYCIWPDGEQLGDGSNWLTKELNTTKPGKYYVRIFDFVTMKWSNIVTITVKEKLTAETISQDTILGEVIGDYDLSKSVKNVKLGDKKLEPKDYTIKISGITNVSRFSIAGNRVYKATITEKTTGSTLEIKIPLNVKWGSTVLLQGLNKQSIGAITLHQKGGDNLELTDNVGVARDPNDTQVHSYFAGKPYYDLRLLGVTSTAQKLKDLKPLTKVNSLTYGYGEDNAQDKINAFGDNGDRSQKASVGDILEVTHEEADIRERLIVNEKETQENAGQKMVYYELTKSGFSPLRVNQLKSKKGTIPLNSNEQYLNQHIKEYVDLKGYSNIEVKKFSSYPATDKLGAASGKIVVEETLKSGKKVQWEYDIPFTVFEDKTKLELQDVELYVGEKFDPDSPFKNVTDKDGNKLSAKDFTHYYIWSDGEEMKLTKELNTSKPGKYNVRVFYFGNGKYSEPATITVKEDKTKRELQDVDLYVGQKFDPDSPLKNVTDADGNKLTADKITNYYIYPEGESPGNEWIKKDVNTNDPGEYRMKIFTLDALGKGDWSNEVKITVKAGPTAEVIPFKTKLGIGTNRYSAKDFVKNVKLDGKLISESNYTVSFVEENRAEKVGKFNFKVKVTINDKKAESILEIPMEVLYGNTLVLKGSSYQPVLGLSTFSYGQDTYSLETSRVKDTSIAIDKINDKFTGKYLGVDMYHIEDDSSALVNLKSYYSFSKKGTDNIDDAYKGFKNQNYQPGDVLKVMHDEVLNYSQMVNVWKDEKEENPQAGYVNKEAYYELRPVGFNALHLNQLEAKSGIIPLDADKEYLNKHIKEYIDTKGYKNIEVSKFLTFPDTKKSGKTEGEIQVLETLQSGKELRYSYKVSFTVDDTLTAKSVPTNINLGTNTKNIDVNSMITDVKSGNKLLSKEDYTVKIKNRIDTKTVGSSEVIVIVSAIGKTVEITVPVTVQWGSTIEVDNVLYPGNTGYALTLHTGDSPKIVATYGNNSEERVRWINDYGANKEYLRTMIYDKENSNMVINDQKPDYQYSMTGKGTIEESVKNFGNSGEYAVNNGDVIGQYVDIAENSESFPDNNRLFKDEKITKENNGLDTVYYEVTKTGFQPLRVNQLKMKSDISMIKHISNDDMEKDIKANPDKYFENPNKYNNVKLVGFVNYPDTSKSGKQPATVRFEETLKSGKKVQYDYDIQVNVDNRWVNVTIPTKMLFFSDSDDKKGVISEEYTIKNNSDNTSLAVEVDSFSVSESSGLKLLKPNEVPGTSGNNKSIDLYLYADRNRITNLYSNMSSFHLADLEPKKSSKIELKGTYQNWKDEKSYRIESSMVLKFNIKE